MATFILYGQTKTEVTLNEINSYPSLKEAQDGANFSIGSCLDDPTVDLQWTTTVPGTWTANYTAPDGEEIYTIHEDNNVPIVRVEDTTIYRQFAALSTQMLLDATIPSLQKKIAEEDDESEMHAMLEDALTIALYVAAGRMQTN